MDARSLSAYTAPLTLLHDLIGTWICTDDADGEWILLVCFRMRTAAYLTYALVARTHAPCLTLDACLLAYCFLAALIAVSFSMMGGSVGCSLALGLYHTAPLTLLHDLIGTWIWTMQPVSGILLSVSACAHTAAHLTYALVARTHAPCLTLYAWLLVACFVAALIAV